MWHSLICSVGLKRLGGVLGVGSAGLPRTHEVCDWTCVDAVMSAKW